MVVAADEKRKQQGKEHAAEDETGAHTVREGWGLLALVDLVVDVVAVVVGAGLRDGLDDSRDVEE